MTYTLNFEHGFWMLRTNGSRGRCYRTRDAAKQVIDRYRRALQSQFSREEEAEIDRKAEWTDFATERALDAWKEGTR